MWKKMGNREGRSDGEEKWYQKFSGIDLLALGVLFLVGVFFLVQGEIFGWAVLFVMIVKLLQKLNE